MTRVVEHWESLPRDVADTPTPETSKVRLNEQSDLFEDVLAYFRGFGQDDL